MDQFLPITTASFLQLRSSQLLLDVRSPSEYAQGHIPEAVNFPLFSDEERAQVGTAYKQQGKKAALLLGLQLVGPKMAGFVEQATALAQDRDLAVHCWRGGQRSQSMAWLFRQAGFRVQVLEGGYKKYRNFVLEAFEKWPLPLIVLGGKTGVGKSKVLRALRQMGEQIIDLEALAHHKGSAFGSIGEAPQPSSEQFENNLFDAMAGLDLRRRIWVENESQSIGKVFLPLSFWRQMKQAPLYNISVPQDARIQNLIDDYAGVASSELEAAFARIEKKLGGQHLKTALEALAQKNFAAAAAIALKYYDKTYAYGLDHNPSPEIHLLDFDSADPQRIAEHCLQLAVLRPVATKNAVPLKRPKILS